MFIADARDPEKIDMVTYVGAHELGHQWWAHQVIGADEQGSTMLDETLAQYSALMVMKHMYGPDMMRKFLKFELDGYLKGRGGETAREPPLEAGREPAVHPLPEGFSGRHRLQGRDRRGERSTRRCGKAPGRDCWPSRVRPIPPPRSWWADFRAVALPDKQQLITDLFEKITLVTWKTKSAVVRKRPDGRWDVTIMVDAKKFYRQRPGRRSVAATEAVDVGVFMAEPGKGKSSCRDVMSMQHLPIHSGAELRVTKAKKPCSPRSIPTTR